MNNSSKIRQSNIELLRIAAMLMIVGHHMAVHGIYHVTAGENAYNVYSMGTQLNKAFTSLFAPGGEIGVAIFFMITGYFQIKKIHFHLRKLYCRVSFTELFVQLHLESLSCWAGWLRCMWLKILENLR